MRETICPSKPGARRLTWAIALAIVTPAETARATTFTKGPYLQALGPTGVTVKVELDAPAQVSLQVVEAGTEKVVGSADALDPVPFHALRVEGLRPGTAFEYRVTAGDAKSVLGHFTTAPDGDRAFRFLVYGDNRTDDVAHAAVIRAMQAAPSDFLINTGDMVPSGLVAHDWEVFFAIENDLLRDRCVFAAIGNHELYKGDPRGGAAFLRYFATIEQGRDRPHLYGSFRWANTRFFLLNAMDSWAGEERDWLRAELDKASAEPGLLHRIAVLHHGPFSSGPHGNNSALAKNDVLGIMRSGKVDLVLAGHDHLYERGEGEGLKYLVSGGAGAPLYKREGHAKETQMVESVHHFIEVTIEGDGVKTVARRASGGIIESCAFRAGSAWACEGASAAVAPTTGVPPAKATGPAPSPSPAPPACACAVPGGAPDREGARPRVLGLATLAAFASFRGRARSRRLLARRAGRYPRAMRRSASSLLARLLALPVRVGALALCTALLASASCATYRQDLDRARAHYEANEYEKALALFRVLEPDMDSLNDSEKIQYAYLRGMTDYRLASLANPGGVTDPKREFRANARHWLAVSIAIEKQTPGGLSTEEKDRLTTALEDLNHDVLGGGDSVPAPGASGAPQAGPPKPAATQDGPGKTPN